MWKIPLPYKCRCVSIVPPWTDALCSVIAVLPVTDNNNLPAGGGERNKGRDSISHFECCHKQTVVEGVSVEQKDERERERESTGNNKVKTESATLITATQMVRQMRWEWISKADVCDGLLKELCSKALLRELF